MDFSRRQALKLAGYGIVGSTGIGNLALGKFAPFQNDAMNLQDSDQIVVIHPFITSQIAGKVIEVDANILDPGKFVQVWDLHGQSDLNRNMHQRWLFLPCNKVGNNVFYIYNIEYKKFLSTMSAPDHGGKIMVVEGFPAENFQFAVIAQADGGIVLAQASTRGAAGYQYDGLENGSGMHFGALPHPQPKSFGLIRNYSSSKIFQFLNRSVTITPMHDRGRRFDIPGGDPTPGVQIQTWDRTPSNINQYYRLEPVSRTLPGNYRIKCVRTGLYLQPFGNGVANGDAIVQMPLSATNKSQIWNFYGMTDGSDFVYIVNTWSGLAIDIKDWKRENGAKLQQFMLHGGENQRFQVELPTN